MNKNLSRLFEIANKKERLIIGLMSGTSLDGLDIACCKIGGAGLQTQIELLAFETAPYTDAIKRKVLEVFAQRKIDFERLCILNAWLGNLHGKMIQSFLKKHNFSSGKIDLIASHGQTVFHSPSYLHPRENINATLQVGDGDHIAVTTGIITVSDFRQKHTAKGGEGAPLAVYGDYLLFSHPVENRILLNIGGIGNFTYLPAGRDSKKMFVTDTGPGNTMIDQKVRSTIPGQHFDRNGSRATEGRVHINLLKALKSDPFFKRSFPKTTGPELFNNEYLTRALKKTNSTRLPLDDILATLTRFSAETIAEGILRATRKSKFELYGSGGGMHNLLLMKWIQEMLEIKAMRTSDELGVPGDAKEAMLFAVLANETIAGEVIDFGSGAKVPGVLMGKISFPD